jgi:hypothetical protein
VVEAILAGARPLLPDRLAYPEVLQALPDPKPYFYDGSFEDMATRLIELTKQLDTNHSIWTDDPHECARAVEHLTWESRVTELDTALTMPAMDLNEN